METWARPLATALTPCLLGAAVGLTAVVLPWVSLAVVGLAVTAGVMALLRPSTPGRRRRLGVALAAIATLLACSAFFGFAAGLNLAQNRLDGWWLGPALGLMAFGLAAWRFRPRHPCSITGRSGRTVSVSTRAA